MNIRNTIKVLIAYLVILLPAVLTLVIFLNIGLNVLRINRGVDFSNIRSQVESYLRSERRDASAKLIGDKLSLRYEYTYPRSQYDYFEKTVNFDPDKEDKIIYVYGSSPAVSKPPFIGDRFSVFSELLEEKLNSSVSKDSFKVYNMAMTSADSSAMYEIVRATLCVKKPDLVIYFYEGGMDYEAAYYAAKVKESFYPVTIFSMNDLLMRTGLSGNKKVVRWSGYVSWFNRCYLQPALMNFLQATNILKIPVAPFTEVNAMITRDLEKNLARTAELVTSQNIPIVFVASSDNLEAKPYGVYSVTQMHFDKAMSATDSLERISFLKEARDSEIFTGDLGARSEAYDVIRGLALKGIDKVYVFDLESDLEEEEYPLGYDSFYDYGHMKPELHRKVADEIYVYLRSERLTPGR
ncbi:MAG: hypothetical protein WBD00_02145 [Candidatus Omnitrophota bacterium]